MLCVLCVSRWQCVVQWQFVVQFVVVVVLETFGVVVGTRGGAGAVVGSSLSPRVVLGVVATVDTAAH